jgi:uncharacterized protein
MIDLWQSLGNLRVDVLLETWLLILLGLITGTISGLIGIGGGVILTPALVYLFGFSQHSAQGTTLALLVPPVSLLAAWTYYQKGNVDLKAATIVFMGFFIGGFFGAQLALQLPEFWLRRIFGIAMMGLAIKMIFAKPSPSTD